MFDLTSNKKYKTQIEPGKSYEIHRFVTACDLFDISPVFCIKTADGEFLVQYFETEDSARQFVISNSGICLEEIVDELPPQPVDRQHILIF